MPLPEVYETRHWKLAAILSQLPRQEWEALCASAEDGDEAARERLVQVFDLLAIVEAYAEGGMAAIRPATLVQSAHLRRLCPTWLHATLQRRALEARK